LEPLGNLCLRIHLLLAANHWLLRGYVLLHLLPVEVALASVWDVPVLLVGLAQRLFLLLLLLHPFVVGVGNPERAKLLLLADCFLEVRIRLDERPFLQR